MLRRFALSAFTFSAAVALAGCHSMGPTESPLQQGEAIEIGFDSPRTIIAFSSDGSARTLADAKLLRGRVLAFRTDSVTMAVDSWVGEIASQNHEDASVSATVSTRDPSVRLTERRISMMKTLLTFGVMLGLVALGIGQAAVA